MKDIIVAFPSKETALKLRALIESEGLHVSYVCALGSSVLNIAQGINECVVVCSSILSDMSAGVLAENLPVGCDVVALSKNGKDDFSGNLINLALPVNRDEFLHTVSVLVSSRSSFTRRTDNENEIISNAKIIVMNAMNISESQAHKYLQQKSMKSGKKLIDLAKEIVNDFSG